MSSATTTSPTESNLLQIVLSVLLPPLGAFAVVGFSGHFWLNLLLTFLGYIPGVIHALWLSLSK